MKAFDYTITDPQGIHARPAGEFVKVCAKYPCNISIVKNDKKVSAKGILGVMSLGVKQGQTITIICEGDGEEEASKALEGFMKDNL